MSFSYEPYSPDQSGAYSESPRSGSGKPKKKLNLTVLFIVLGSVLGAALIGTAVFLTIRFRKPRELAVSYEPVAPAEIVFGEGTPYVDSQLLLTAEETASYGSVKKLLASVGGEIIGYIELSNDYQVRLPKGKPRAELEELAIRLEGDPLVLSCALHEVFNVSGAAVDYSSDPWLDTSRGAAQVQNTSWSAVTPGGNNWWAEAIGMPTLWDLGLTFRETRVGIIDGMFDDTHPDLDDRFVRIYDNPLTPVSAIYNDPGRSRDNGHGTHVAGIVAAEGGNGEGITGVAQNARLCGVALYTEDAPDPSAAGNSYHGIFAFKYAIARLVNDRVKVINISMAMEELTIAAYYDEVVQGLNAEGSDALRLLAASGRGLEVFLSRAFRKWDFLIVKGAGNNRVHHCVRSSADPEHTHNYSIFIDRNNEFGDHWLPLFDVDAKYDVFGCITNEDVRSRILMVGSVDLVSGEYNGASSSENLNVRMQRRTFELSDFSNVGADIWAPGGTLVEWEQDPSSGFLRSASLTVLSTVPDGGTCTKYGTSMASPMVAGAAALIWGLYPDASAEEVSYSLTHPVSPHAQMAGYSAGEYGGNTLDVFGSVRCAMEMADSGRLSGSGSAELIGKQFITGFAYVIVDDKGDSDPTNDDVEFPSDTVVVLCDQNWNEKYRLTLDADDCFSALVEPGDYYLRAVSDSYSKTFIGEVLVKEDEPCYARLLLKDRLLAEYAFAIHQTIKSGNWNETTEAVVTISGGLFGKTVDGDLASRGSYEIRGYDPEDPASCVITGVGELDFLKLIVKNYSLDYRNGNAAYTFSMLGQQVTHTKNELPGIFDFYVVTQKNLSAAYERDGSLCFGLDPDSLDGESFSIFSAFENVDNLFFRDVTMTITLNKDMSLSLIEISMEGGLSYQGISCGAVYTLRYEFSKP